MVDLDVRCGRDGAVGGRPWDVSGSGSVRRLWRRRPSTSTRSRCPARGSVAGAVVLGGARRRFTSAHHRCAPNTSRRVGGDPIECTVTAPSALGVRRARSAGQDGWRRRHTMAVDRTRRGPRRNGTSRVGNVRWPPCSTTAERLARRVVSSSRGRQVRHGRRGERSAGAGRRLRGSSVVRSRPDGAPVRHASATRTVAQQACGPGYTARTASARCDRMGRSCADVRQSRRGPTRPLLDGGEEFAVVEPSVTTAASQGATDGAARRAVGPAAQPWTGASDQIACRCDPRRADSWPDKARRGALAGYRSALRGQRLSAPAPVGGGLGHTRWPAAEPPAVPAQREV